VSIALGLLLGASGLLLGACGNALDPDQARREMIDNQIRSSYEDSLASMRPSHVFVTYPGTIGSMPDHKRHELDIVKSVLSKRKLPFRVVDRATVLETLSVGKRNPVEVHAYWMPDELVEQSRGTTVLFLNLDVRDALRTALHPEASANGVRVMVWDDPIKLAGGGAGGS
jgi:hypothetical protein